mgnify:CR=1
MKKRPWRVEQYWHPERIATFAEKERAIQRARDRATAHRQMYRIVGPLAETVIVYPDGRTQP